MMGLMTLWDDLEPILRDHMNAVIESNPEVLLERAGGPVGMTADVILARLIGFDDQIVDDTLRLHRVEPVWLVPIPERRNLAAEVEPADYYDPTLRTARYELQSGYVTTRLDGIYAPPGVKPGPPLFLVSVLFVRYRRRT